MRHEKICRQGVLSGLHSRLRHSHSHSQLSTRSMQGNAGSVAGRRLTKSFTHEEIDCARKLAFNSIPLMFS